jgi:hypothetical protein
VTNTQYTNSNGVLYANIRAEDIRRATNGITNATILFGVVVALM